MFLPIKAKNVQENLHPMYCVPIKVEINVKGFHQQLREISCSNENGYLELTWSDIISNVEGVK